MKEGGLFETASKEVTNIASKVILRQRSLVSFSNISHSILFF